VSPKEHSFSAMVGQNTHRLITLVSATLTIAGSVIAFKRTESLSNSQSLGLVLGWVAVGIIFTYLLSRLQAWSQEQSSDAIKARVSQLESELRSQVRSRSYGARRDLIMAPLYELDLDITPRVGWVRDSRLVEPAPTSERLAGIVAAFESSERRLLIVGEPGLGKTMLQGVVVCHATVRAACRAAGSCRVLDANFPDNPVFLGNYSQDSSGIHRSVFSWNSGT
jgi:hypothetical protein